MKKYLVIMIILVATVLGAVYSTSKETETTSEIMGKVTNKEVAENIKQVLETNLKYAENGDIEGYLTTIVGESQIETKKAMSKFFEEFSVSHELTCFEIVEQKKDEIAAKAIQKTIDVQKEGKKKYKSHTSESLLMFKKEPDGWKIAESSIIDIKFNE